MDKLWGRSCFATHNYCVDRNKYIHVYSRLIEYYFAAMWFYDAPPTSIVLARTLSNLTSNQTPSSPPKLQNTDYHSTSHSTTQPHTAPHSPTQHHTAPHSPTQPHTAPHSPTQPHTAYNRSVTKSHVIIVFYPQYFKNTDKYTFIGLHIL